ncbi:MotE family protein [Bacillus songklensis]|uniref:MotE family protein n=1 Tax=Bacillus songklensis TaxID=1069116 RepID=A0ABV8B081_9BACI
MSKTTERIEEERQHSKGQVFLFVIFIPTLFSIALIYTILTVADINITEKIKTASGHIPFVASSKEEKNVEEQAVQKSKEIKQLEQALQEKNEKVHNLMDTVNEKEMAVEQLQVQVQQLKEQLKEAEANKQEQEIKMQEVVNTYEKMTPKKAALILSELEADKAVLLLEKLKTDQRTAILEKMEPAVAARYTVLLSEKVSEEVE